MLQERLKQYIQDCGSQAEAARRIGYSSAVISTYLAGTYKGNVSNFESKLSEIFANLDAEKELQIGSNTYVRTSISTAVYSTIRMCHLKGGLAIECGDAGIGKTMACRQYVADYPNTAIYISVNPCIATTAAFLKCLCMALNMPTGRKDDMWLRLCDRLKGERKVLIIDEAQHLPIKTIESIRAFFDAYPEIGVCMVGNEDTYSNLHRGRAAFAQIVNRTKLTEIRHTQSITSSDIELLFPALRGKQKEIQLVLKIARSEQGIRGAQNLYSNACNNNDITFGGLIEMAKYMKILIRA
jgi:DNA transposition AAA+ family ATPase